MACGKAEALRRLKACRLRPTRQRLALAGLLFDTAPRHVTADELYQEALDAGIHVSLATVYNTLNQFTAAGLMSEVVVGSGQSYFDTTASSHWHYFDRLTGEITDIPAQCLTFREIPKAPPGKVIERIDVVIRVRSAYNPPNSDSTGD
jgi:Fur family iron response transcriptional regulator